MRLGHVARAVGIAAALTLALAPGAQATRELTLGFSDDGHLTGGTTASRLPWIERAVSDGASVVRVNVEWAQVAPATRPPGFDPTDPASPAYDFSGLDATVRDLAGHGLRVLLSVGDAPAWAEAPHRPRAVQPGTWRPDAAQLGEFARAIARRYDGSFPDPADPRTTLPRVSLWQAWNEPNLDYYLAPQWVRTRQGFRAVAPGLYRGLLNSFYAAVKQVSRSNYVLMAGTGPYGVPPGIEPLGQQRTEPVDFYRGVFSGVVHLDAIDHHPYGVGGPTWHAINPGDVAVPDMYKILRVLRAAERSGHVLPRGHKGVWVSELGWSSRPPNPKGVPVQKDARWYEQAFYVLWRQGVDTILPLEIADPSDIADYRAVFESGIYYADGRPKPIAQAYRFPFVTQRLSRASVRAWGRAPQAGRLAIQVRARGGRWRTLKRLAVGDRQVFLASLALRGRALLRAVDGSQVSLTWRQGG